MGWGDGGGLLVFFLGGRFVCGGSAIFHLQLLTFVLSKQKLWHSSEILNQVTAWGRSGVARRAAKDSTIHGSNMNRAGSVLWSTSRARHPTRSFAMQFRC